MKSRGLAGLGLAALGLVPSFAAGTHEPPLAVYRWGIAPAANEAFAAWLNRPIVWAEDFEGNESWDNVANPGWQFPPWAKWKLAKPGRRLILSITILPGPWDGSGPKQGALEVGKPVSLEAGARGDYNQRFRILAEQLVATGLDDTILRLGWEFNGGWYTWRAKGQETAYAEYWRQIVKTMRAVPGAAKLRFCWNPAQGYQQFPAELAWPGDAFVDFVGLDLYDDCWLQNTYPWPADASAAEIDARRKQVWEELLRGNHGLMFWKKFAADHGKPFSIPEWGVDNRADKHGGLDNPFFVEQMHRFITDAENGVAFHCYFDVQAGDGHHQLSPGAQGGEQTEFPQSAARFKALFSRPAVH